MRFRVSVMAVACAATSILVVPAAMAAPTVVTNVQGYTLANNKLVSFSGLAFDKGKVLATGNNTALVKRYRAATLVDGEGKTMLPGLFDVHGHVFRLGFRRNEVLMGGTQNLDEALSKIRDYAKANPNRQWLLGSGWNQVIWKLGRFPTAVELDSAVADRPMTLRRVDGHATWANSKALQAAGITRDTPDPAGGRIERDAAGNPSGVLVDKAQLLVTNIIPAPSDDERRLALSTALAHFGSLGLTSVGDAGIGVDEARIYREFADQKKLTTRVYAMISDVGDDFRALNTKGPLKGYAQDRYNLRAVKLRGDGALGSRGAAMLEPYSDDHGNKGLLLSDDATMNSKVRIALKAGYQVNTHAIGDAANHQILNAYEAAYKDVGGRGLRNRIEHAQVVTPADIPRFKTLDLIASMQPTHATSDMNMAEDRIGKERLKGAYAWHTFLQQGTVVAGGSDFPVESANPFYGLHAAVTRTDHEGKPAQGWHPEEAMTLLQAFRAFTLDAAYAQHQEKVLGSLQRGKWADFILVDQDPFKAPAADLWKTQVLQTWVGGERVFRKE
ncbi:amidohydrolase [Variovorax sp. dw_954]|uniref:amidohydrolase n=1 Tax=Variovorax sp. dw_954 TaxID=2720078 RepID=UPI001BD29F35|nr:amidohydrolase [Variovorax sp. dw_954]